MNLATAESILNAAIDLYRERGFNGTSIKQIVGVSATTTGSVYHFFPQGKDQLTIEAMRLSGPQYQALLEGILDSADDLPSGIYSVFAQAGATLEQTDFIDPCPIGGIAREVANTKPALRQAVDEVFTAWRNALTTRLTETGISQRVAEDIAITFVASIEGGFTLARTYRSAEPLHSIGRVISAVVATELKSVR